MKISDLKAFVETKILSKSEKALEKIGQMETKSLEDHVSIQVNLSLKLFGQLSTYSLSVSCFYLDLATI